MNIHRFKNFGQKKNESGINENEIAKAEVKWVMLETRNFTFGAVYPIDTSDDEIRREAITMARGYIKKSGMNRIDGRVFDIKFWNATINEEMRIVEVPLGKWHRDFEQFNY